MCSLRARGDNETAAMLLRCLRVVMLWSRVVDRDFDDGS